MNKKIGIIGDVHAEDVSLALVIDWFDKKSVDAIICTGDIADGPGDIDMACELLASHNVSTVAGNHDRWLLADKVRHVENAHLKNAICDSSLQFLSHLPKSVSLPTPSGELLLCHGVIDDDLAKVWPGTAATEIERSLPLDQLLAQVVITPRFIVNGHMHFRTLIDFEHCQLINGGTLKGLYSGVSILDLDAQTLTGFDLCSDRGFIPAQRYSIAERGARRVWRDTQDFDGHWAPAILHCPL